MTHYEYLHKPIIRKISILTTLSSMDLTSLTTNEGIC